MPTRGHLAAWLTVRRSLGSSGRRRHRRLYPPPPCIGVDVRGGGEWSWLEM